MRITWDERTKEFRAELQPGPAWHTEQATAKQAGFKSSGPPDWIWRTGKAAVLTKLRMNRPVSGLTISTDARIEYDRLKSIEDANAAVVKQLKDAKKAQKKELQESGTGGTGFEYDQDGWAVIEPADSTIWRPDKYKPPVPPAEHCTVCSTPIYFHERHDPPICLECEFSEEL
jgi:hypothetical protein